MSNVEVLLRPRQVAIVGDSPGAGRGGWIHEQLVAHGFDGPVYPINPKYEEVRGLRAYPSLRAVPGPVEFMAVALGAAHAVRVMTEGAEVGVRAALFIASGFAEAGEGGRALQGELARIARAHDIAVCGPNCYGIANLHENFVAYGGPLAQPMRKGPVALVYQSGALTHGSTDPAVLRDIGYSYVITTGNEAVTELADYIDVIADDPVTRVIACFVEGFKDPARFFRAARKAIVNGQRLVVLKVGRSALAKQATLAHTGSLAGEDSTLDAAFRRLGIVRVHDLDELIEAVEFFSYVPHIGAGTVAVSSISGGSCGIMADLAEDVGLTFAPLGAETRTVLEAVLPDFASVNNPLDLTGAVGEQPEILDSALATLDGDPQIALVAFAMNTPTTGDEIGRSLYRRMAASIARAGATASTPFAMFTMTSGAFDAELVAIAHDAGLPLMQGFRESLYVIARVQEASRAIDRWRDPDTLAGPEPIGLRDLLRSFPGPALTERASKRLLSAVGIDVPAARLTRMADEASAVAADIGFPVAMKVESPDILHKTDAGGVRLDVRSAEEAGLAFREICSNARRHAPDSELRGVLVEEMVPDGVDVLVGVTNRGGVGPAVVFGLGGVFVEALDDVAVRMAPVALEEAHELIQEIKGAQVLQGFRGVPPADVDALAELVVTISRLAWWLRDAVSELDVNPVRVFGVGRGAKALDALVVRSTEGGS